MKSKKRQHINVKNKLIEVVFMPETKMELVACKPALWAHGVWPEPTARYKANKHPNNGDRV